MIEGAALALLYACDFGLFVQRAFQTIYPDEQLDWAWAQEVVVHSLNEMIAGRRLRQMVLVPPRSLKSFICSVALPAFVLGIRPSAKIIVVSYAQPLSDDLGRYTLELMNSPWYQTVFATRLSGTRCAAEQFTTTVGGYRLATSVGGTLTGRGADIIIIDDPIKAEDAMSSAVRKTVGTWFTNTLLSRLNHKAQGKILLVMQRLHQDDLAGRLMEQGGWDVLRLQAIATHDEEHRYDTIAGPRVERRKEGEPLHPSREPAHVLEQMKRDMGSYTFAAQYQQDPTPVEGLLIKRDWFVPFEPTELPTEARIIQSWDTAQKPGELNDYTVCTTWGVMPGRRCYLIHTYRKRLTYPDLKRAVREQAELHNAEIVLIEDKVSGTSLIQDLTNEGFYKVKAIQPKGDKVMRLHGVSGLIENGLVHIPREAAWLDDYLDEVVAFPGGRHDDQVDSTTQALAWIREAGTEPGLITYYREEHEARERARTALTVRMRCTDPTISHAYLRDGTCVGIGADRYCMMTAEKRSLERPPVRARA